jgi:hypothetical protein
MRVRSLLPLLLLLAACSSVEPELTPESDAHAVMDPERDIVLHDATGARIQVTDLEGAEDGETLSPDGRWVAFVGGETGIASVWVARVPAAGAPPHPPIQLTNVGLEARPRTPGQAPEGFVPPPDRGALRWAGDRTVTWTAGGVEYSAEVPK